VGKRRKGIHQFPPNVTKRSSTITSEEEVITADTLKGGVGPSGRSVSHSEESWVRGKKLASFASPQGTKALTRRGLKERASFYVNHRREEVLFSGGNQQTDDYTKEEKEKELPDLSPSQKRRKEGKKQKREAFQKKPFSLKEGRGVFLEGSVKKKHKCGRLLEKSTTRGEREV